MVGAVHAQGVLRCLEDTTLEVYSPLVPVFLVETRTDERLLERSVPRNPVPTAHKDDVVDPWSVRPIGVGRVLEDETGREHQVGARRPVVRDAGVRVQVLGRYLAGVDQLEAAPVEEVVGGSASDPANATLERAVGPTDASCEDHVLTDPFVPECDVE